MADGTSSTTKFFEEFPSLLESLVTVPGSLLMVGDFNFHVNDASDRGFSVYLKLLISSDTSGFPPTGVVTP